MEPALIQPPPAPLVRAGGDARTRGAAPQGVWLRRALARIRIGQWGHFLVLPLAGIEPTRALRFSVGAVARGVGVCAAVLAFGYLLNAVADRHMDLDLRKNPLAGADRVAGGAFRPALTLLAAAALALAATGPLLALVCAAASLSCGWAYSAGPRLKAVPLLGTAMNVGNFVPLLFVGLATEALPAGMFPLAGVFAALLLQNQLLHEAADAEEDRRGGVLTTYLWLGPRGCAAIAAGCGLLAWAAGRYLAHGATGRAWLLAHVLVFGVVFPLALLLGPGAGRRPARLRLLHRGCCVVAGAFFFAQMHGGTVG